MVIGTWAKTKWWGEYATEILPTGSRVICNPPPKKTDEDFLLLVDKETVPKLEEKLKAEGFIVGGSPDKNKNRGGWRIGQAVYDTPGRIAKQPSVWAGWEETTEKHPDSKSYVKYIYKGFIKNPEPLVEFPDFSNPEKKGIFHSFKKDDLNLIITCSTEYFENFAKATKLATSLNLLEKPDRVTVFEAICFDKWPTGLSSIRRTKFDLGAFAVAPLAIPEPEVDVEPEEDWVEPEEDFDDDDPDGA